MEDKKTLIGHLGSGEEVWDRALKPYSGKFDDKDGVWRHLTEALAKIDSEGRESIEQEARFDKVVGWTNIVMTGPGDRRMIVWYKLPGRSGHTRVVLTLASRDPTRLMTLMLNQRSPSAYELSSFRYGPWTPPEPWEPGAGPEALAFWLTHAVLRLSLEESADRDMTDRMPPEWQTKIDLYGDTEVVKEALQRKEEPDMEIERMRKMAKAVGYLSIEIGQDLSGRKPDGTVH